jgi:hypothetical protein
MIDPITSLPPQAKAGRAKAVVVQRYRSAPPTCR